MQNIIVDGNCIYKNLGDFYKWLEKNVRADYKKELYLGDLVEKADTIGFTDYELPWTETKSKRPECYSYHYNIYQSVNGDDDYIYVFEF